MLFNPFKILFKNLSCLIAIQLAGQHMQFQGTEELTPAGGVHDL
jgi:hypothetical protein